MSDDNVLTQPQQQHHPFGPSALERRWRCPMSYHIEKDLPDVPSEEAEAGTDLHAQMRNLIESLKDESGALKMPDGIQVGTLPQPIETMLVRLMDIYSGYEAGSWPDDRIFTEVQLPLPEVTGDGEATYGTADCVILRPDSVVVIDWKTGRGETVDVCDNLQTAAYCVAAARKFGVDSATAYIVNPNFRQEPGFLFTREMLDYALRQIIEIKEAGEECDRSPDPSKCVPGDIQCKYCKAALHGTCPAFRGIATELYEVAKRQPLEMISTMPDSTLVDVVEKGKLISKLADAAEKELKDRCEKQGEVCGYFLKEVSGGREADDLKGLWAMLRPEIDQETFLSCCKISIPSLEKLFIKAIGSPFKEGKERFADLTADYVSEKPPKKMLAKVKGEK
jgi:CRISPR/Cas system-associated exonuclease Cas4 (RecB family)